MADLRGIRLRAVADIITPLILLLLIPVSAAWYVADHNSKVRVYNAAVAACDRGNRLRDRINTKFAVYDTAMEETAKALKAAETPVGHRLYEVFHAAAVTQPEPLPLTPCLDVYEKPRWFWDRGRAKKPVDPPGLTGPTGVTTEGGKG